MKKILTKTRNKHQSEKYWNMIDKCCFVYLYTKHESLKHIESSENRYFWFPKFFLGKLYALSFFSFFCLNLFQLVYFVSLEVQVDAWENFLNNRLNTFGRLVSRNYHLFSFFVQSVLWETKARPRKCDY